MSESPRFIPVDFQKHQELCLKFTADAFTCSFGDDSRFTSGSRHYLKPEKYLEWLKEKIAAEPASSVHVWVGDKIVGQMELGSYRNDKTLGYVYLYYLIPEARGTGISKYLDQYACDFLRRGGYSKAILSVTKTNARALSYYRKMGWQELTISPDDPDAILMQKLL